MTSRKTKAEGALFIFPLTDGLDIHNILWHCNSSVVFSTGLCIGVHWTMLFFLFFDNDPSYQRLRWRVPQYITYAFTYIYTSSYCNYRCVQMARNRGMMVIHGHCSSFCLVFVICSLVVVVIIIVKFCELTHVFFFLFISSSIHKIMK